MKKVSGPQVVTPAEALERPLPAEIRRRWGSWSAPRGRGSWR